ncbi:MAG: hypothetical protein WD077_09180 [Bacteroidia bacterium]
MMVNCTAWAQEGNAMKTLPVDTPPILPDPMPLDTPPFGPEPLPLDTPASTLEDKVFNKLEDLAEKPNILGRLVRSVLVTQNVSHTGVAEQDTFKTSDEPYEKYKGLPIRSVEVKVLDVFGPTLEKPDQEARSILQKAGNFIHIKTRERKVRDFLLFEEGDAADPISFAESERLLRLNEFVYDARVIVENADSSGVDVVVLIQDTWSITGEGGYDFNRHTGDLKATDFNFLGYGHLINGGLSYLNRQDLNWIYNAEYIMPNIRRSYVSGRGFFLRDELQTIYGFNIDRGFYSYETKWAGGLSAYSRKHLDQYQFDTVYFEGESVLNVQDFWFGHSLTAGNEEKRDERLLQILAARVIRSEYNQKPQHYEIPPEAYQNSWFYLVGAGFSKRKFYQDNHVFGFGKTEDVPEGSLISVVAGYEDGSITNRLYGGFSVSAAKYSSVLGYIRGGLNAGSYYNGTKWDQGVMQADFLYFTNMLPVGKFMIRQYLWNRLTLGLNRRSGEWIYVNENDGLRGIKKEELRGTQKLTMNYEANIFTPWEFFGFQMAGVVFADFAWIGTSDNSLLSRRLYQGYGLGVRFKNEHLIFNTIQISIAYYPQLEQQELKNFHFLSSHRTFFRFNDFIYGRPDVLGFR